MKQKPFKLPFKDDVAVAAAINRLPKTHRGIIARIIWWDFYAGRLVCNRTRLFDCWLNEAPLDVEPSSEKLSGSLQEFGYDKDTADKKFSKTYNPKPRI